MSADAYRYFPNKELWGCFRLKAYNDRLCGYDTGPRCLSVIRSLPLEVLAKMNETGGRARDKRDVTKRRLQVTEGTLAVLDGWKSEIGGCVERDFIETSMA